MQRPKSRLLRQYFFVSVIFRGQTVRPPLLNTRYLVCDGCRPHGAGLGSRRDGGQGREGDGEGGGLVSPL